MKPAAPSPERTMKRHDLAAGAALFALTLLIAGVFWALLPAEYRQNQSTDYTAHYEPVARAILAGRGIVDETGALATRYPPGFSLLLASDVRYGAPDLRMNAAYIKIGLGGCDMGASYFLPRLVGSSVASEYLLTGRFMTADKALACGLLSEVAPQEELLGKTLAVAEEMLQTSPLGLRLTKDALNLNIDAASMEHAFGLEDRQQIMLSQTADSVEARVAFFEKRAPEWRDR